MAVTSVHGAPYSVTVAQCSPWGRGAMTGAQGATCTTEALRARSSGQRAARLILSPLQAGTVQPLGVQSHNRRTGCAISCRRYRHAVLGFRSNARDVSPDARMCRLMHGAREYGCSARVTSLRCPLLTFLLRFLQFTQFTCSSRTVHGTVHGMHHP